METGVEVGEAPRGTGNEHDLCGVTSYSGPHVHPARTTSVTPRPLKLLQL